MTPRMAAALREVETAREELLAVVRSIDEATLDRVPQDGTWSPAEVLEHLRLVEEGSVKLLERRLQRAREQGLGAAEPGASADGDAVVLPDTKLAAPDMMRPATAPSSRSVMEGLQTSRQALRRLLETASPFDVSKVTARHLALGELDFYRWIHFIGAHERRHTAQIARILEGPPVSAFTNSAADAKANADVYKNSLLELLGDRDALTVFAELPNAIDELTKGLSEHDATRPERPGKWSVIQVVQHLVDSEVVYAYRARLIVAEREPAIVGYDQDRWSTMLHYSAESLADSLNDLRVMRGRNLRLLRRLNDEELDRFGMHNERGPESVREMVRLLAGHDLLHRAQIARVRRTLGV
ncbi:MAG: DinB family protein [Gemmatimonadaceae bacterium]